MPEQLLRRVECEKTCRAPDSDDQRTHSYKRRGRKLAPAPQAGTPPPDGDGDVMRQQHAGADRIMPPGTG